MRPASYFLTLAFIFSSPFAHADEREDLSRLKRVARQNNLFIDPDTSRAALLTFNLAAHWKDEGMGRKNLVFDFDYTPEQTLKELIFIYSTAYLDLEKGKPIGEVMADKEQRLEILYASGESRFRLVNPLENDWKPFLLELEKKLAKWSGSVGQEAFYRPTYAGVYLGLALIELAITGLEEKFSHLPPPVDGEDEGTALPCSSLMDGPPMGKGTGERRPYLWRNSRFEFLRSVN